MNYIPTYFKTYALCSNEIRLKREEICKNCEHLNTLNQCSVCHCFMFIKNKFEECKCPIGKW